MNTKELPEYASLKNANGTLFELQTKSLLYDSILEGELIIKLIVSVEC